MSERVAYRSLLNFFGYFLLSREESDNTHTIELTNPHEIQSQNTHLKIKLPAENAAG